ncbi:hypothetical protein ZWY2020_047051 [Hordeum vulgare]|nr:hypothetical protein ZWY2020_047051 [Hordeum vulgare]
MASVAARSGLRSLAARARAPAPAPTGRRMSSSAHDDAGHGHKKCHYHQTGRRATDEAWLLSPHPTTPPRRKAQKRCPPSASARGDGGWVLPSWGPSRAVMALVALLGLGVPAYIVSPPLYSHVAEALDRSPGACHACACDCDALPLPQLPEGTPLPVGAPCPDLLAQIWYINVPHTKLVQYKGQQNWVNVSGEHLVFPGGGTQIKHGVTMNALGEHLVFPGDGVMMAALGVDLDADERHFLVGLPVAHLRQTRHLRP